MRKNQWLKGCLSALALSACGNAGIAANDAVGAPSDVGLFGDVQFTSNDIAADSGSSDLVSPGVDIDGPSDLSGGSDAVDTTDAIDAGTDSFVDSGCEFPASPGVGESGHACSSNTQCDSGYCVDAPDGKVCSMACVSCCPSGFTCGQVSGGADTAYICLAQFNALCRPCNTDAECGAVNAGALCVKNGDAGSFCGGACSQDADCPGGYGCKPSQGEKGAGQQCILLSGTCGCSQKSTFDGASTTCAQSNDFGSCPGTRKCALSGLTACTAATPAQEVCNGKDDNCDGVTDGSEAADCVTYFKDADGDGAGVGAGTCLCAPVGLATATTNGDCNDDNAAVHPGATEICNDIDDNCNGLTDEGCDKDGDGYCDAAMVVVGSPVVCKYGTKDCNDNDPNVHPNAPEICGNGIDDDCNGVTDDNASTTFYQDSDGDGFGNAAVTQQACAKPVGYVTVAGDCDDNNAAVHPGAPEICDGLDNNCDGITDGADISGCKAYFTDNDGDGFGVGTSSCLCKPDGALSATVDGDCDDANSSVHPGAVEFCNGVDDDCDGVTDPAGSEGCDNYYLDGDGDGFGTSSVSAKCLCAPAGAYTALIAGDCDDTVKTTFPGATEVCNGVDDNCNGLVDEGVTTLYFADADKDGFGNAAVTLAACTTPAGYVSDSSDCDDGKKAVHPGAMEICNGIDDNCNGLTDEGVTNTYYQDNDGDGYGSSMTTSACSAPAGYVAISGDCADGTASIHPGAPEVCNGLDDNCNGATDEGNPGGGASCTTGKLGVCAAGTTACASGSLNCSQNVMASVEVCDGLDNDCNGTTDEGCAVPTCSASTIQNLADGHGGHGWSLGTGWVDGGTNDFWGAAWALVYSNDPSSGYNAGGSSSSHAFTIAAGTKSVQVDVSAFYNVRDTNCSNAGDCFPSSPDTNIKLTLTLSTGGSNTLGPFGSSQFSAGAKTLTAPLPANFAGGSVTVTLTIANAASYDSCYYAGIGINKIEGVCY